MSGNTVRTRPMALDSGTSAHAASKQTTKRVSLMQVAVVALIAQAGDRGLTDDECFEAYSAYSAMHPTTVPRATPQNCRTRRAEAVRQGLVKDSGRRRDSRYGNPATVWVVPNMEAPTKSLPLW